MGFEGMASLTHHMEDVFELLKQRRGGLDRAAIDVLLECLDALEAAVDAIEADGTEHLDPAALNDRLQALVRAPEPAAEVADGAPVPAAEMAAAAAAAGARVVHVVATLTDDTLMPSVRAYMVLAAIAEHGELVASVAAPRRRRGLRRPRGRGVAGVATHEDDAPSPPSRASRTSPAHGAPSSTRRPPRPPRPRPPAAAPSPRPAPRPRRPPRPRAPPRRKKAAATVRVDAERLDALMHTMGELVVHRTLVESLAAAGRRAGPEPGDAGAHALLAGPAGRWSCRSA